MKNLSLLKCRFSFTILFCLLVNISVQKVPSQTTSETPTPMSSPTPESEETRKRKERIEELKLQKEEQELENAINAAKYPKPTTTPLDGKTEVDAGVKIESEMLAYRALSTSANNLFTDIKDIKGVDGGKIKSLAIFDDGLVKTMLSYSVSLNQMNLMKKEYEIILEKPKSLQDPNGEKLFPAVIAGIAAAQSIVGSFVDLMALLRADTKITGNQFTIGDSAFVSEVFRAVKSSDKTINLFYPAQFSPKGAGTKEYVILGKIQELFFVKANSEQLVNEIDETEKAFDEAAKTKEILKNRSEQILKELKTLNEELKRLQSLNSHLKHLKTNSTDSPGIVEIWQKIRDIKAQIKNLEKEREELPQKQSKNDLALTALENRLNELYEQINLPVSQTRTNSQAAATREELEAAISGLTTNAVSEIQKKLIRKSKKSAVLRLKTLNAQFNNFYNEITKVDTAAGINALTSYIKAENLKNALGCKIAEDTCDNTYLLSLKVISAGGNNRTKKNLFTTVFTGADITHSGGAIVEYRLYDMEGLVRSSNTFRIYEYYRKPKTVTKMSNGDFETNEQKRAEKAEEKRRRKANAAVIDN